MSAACLFRVIVCAAIRNAEGKILLARRKPEKILGGFWEFPGGKLESGEALEDALRRELREELEIEIANVELLHVEPYHYDHGDVVILFYACDWAEGEIKLHDHDAVAWCAPNELQAFNLLPANQTAIAKLRELRK